VQQGLLADRGPSVSLKRFAKANYLEAPNAAEYTAAGDEPDMKNPVKIWSAA
jgi:hypothetical protein